MKAKCRQRTTLFPTRDIHYLPELSVKLYIRAQKYAKDKSIF
jgi:hypothetical protein